MGVTNYEVMLDNGVLSQLVNGLSILAVNPYAVPTRTLGNWLLARSDKRKINSSFITERHIFVQAMIQQNTRALLDPQWDAMQTIAQVIEKTLIIPWGTGRRQFTVSLATYSIDESAGGYIKFTLDFICSDNFGYDTAPTTLIQASGRTLYNYTDNFQLSGSAPWQVPIMKFSWQSLTGATNATVTISNPATNAVLTVSRTFLAGDLLTIDSQNKTVQVNGADVDFVGGIPEWKTNGVGYLNYKDNFSTRSLTELVTVNRRWS